MVSFQERQDGFGRPADRGVSAFHDDRTLQQDGVRGDRVHDLRLGEVRLPEFQRLEFRLSVTDQLAWIAAFRARGGWSNRVEPYPDWI